MINMGLGALVVAILFYAPWRWFDSDFTHEAEAARDEAGVRSALEARAVTRWIYGVICALAVIGIVGSLIPHL